VGVTAASAQAALKAATPARRSNGRGVSRLAEKRAPRDGAERHHRGQELVLLRAAVEDGDRHGGDEDPEVQAEGPDEEQHQEDALELRACPDVAEAVGEAAAGRRGALDAMELARPQESQGAEHGAERRRVDQEQRAGADGGDEESREHRTDYARGIDEVEFSPTAFDSPASPTISDTKAWRAGASKADTEPSRRANV
jgi:hypothetical protein